MTRDRKSATNKENKMDAIKVKTYTVTVTISANTGVTQKDDADGNVWALDLADREATGRNMEVVAKNVLTGALAEARKTLAC